MSPRISWRCLNSFVNSTGSTCFGNRSGFCIPGFTKSSRLRARPKPPIEREFFLGDSPEPCDLEPDLLVSFSSFLSFFISCFEPLPALVPADGGVAELSVFGASDVADVVGADSTV